MLNTCSIGRGWKSREGWSRPVLTGERGTLSNPCWVGSRPVVVFLVGWRGMLFPVVTTIGKAFCLRPLSGSRTATIGIVVGSVAGRSVGSAVQSGFAVVMAQVRRPVPFRTRKLRPGCGDGTALERVWESSAPPHSTVWRTFRSSPVQGFPEGPFFFVRVGVPAGRHAPGTLFVVFVVFCRTAGRNPSFFRFSIGLSGSQSFLLRAVASMKVQPTRLEIV